MPSLNKVTLIGRLVRDPELSYTSAGLAVAKFSVAVDRQKNSQTGEKKTDFFRCNAWRQTAEFVEKYVQKGRLVAVDGRIELNEYTDKEGQKKFSTDIVCNNVELLDSNRDAPGDAAPGGGNYNAPAQSRNNDGGNSGGNAGGDDDGGYFADEEPAPRRQAAPQQSAPTARPQQQQRPPAPAPAARPAQRPAPAQAAAYPADDDFDDSDPFADE